MMSKMYDCHWQRNSESKRYFYVKNPIIWCILTDNSEIKLHSGAENRDEKVKGAQITLSIFPRVIC